MHAYSCLVAILELQHGVCLLPLFLRKHWETNGPLTERVHTSGGPVPNEGGRKENPASTCLLGFEHRRVLRCFGWALFQMLSLATVVSTLRIG